MNKMDRHFVPVARRAGVRWLGQLSFALMLIGLMIVQGAHASEPTTAGLRFIPGSNMSAPEPAPARPTAFTSVSELGPVDQ